ncbi:MAG: hypothetical protein ABIT82_11740 [Ramlibacter sp.]
MPSRIPPRYVPTLTEVVKSAAGPASAAAALSQEQLVHRIMQRIDLSLDRKLREAIATTVLEQTRLLGPLLREEIEIAVRQTVSQALAEELNAGTKPARA